MSFVQRHPAFWRVLGLKAGLLTVWASLSFGVCFFARDLQWHLGPWPLAYWVAAQGALLGFILIVVVDAWVMALLQPEDQVEDDAV